MLAVSIVALMLLATVPSQVARGQGSYTEKLNVFVAGSDALWYFTFGGLNGSTKLSGFESTAGLTWYNVTAIKTTGWQSDFQIFGPKGYNLLPVPSVLPQGMFLTLGSDSYTDAAAAALALDSYLLTSFVSLSNGTGAYSFYSPLSFDELVPSTLLRFLPTSEGGFSSAIASSSFTSTASPFVVLEGQKASSGFSHSLVVGSITASALDSLYRPNVLGYFGTSLTSLKSSNQSSSSVIQLKFLDGIVKSTDKAAVSSNGASFTGSYSLSLVPGKGVTRINATVVEQPAPLLATRAADVGVLHNNDTIAVTLSLKNLSPSDTITRVYFSDNWWNSTGVFKFLGGNYTVPSTGLSAGGSITPVYRLRYTGSGTGSFTIPASVVRYTYEEGAAVFNATTVLNPIRLSLGVDDAVVYATVAPVGSLGKSVGTPQSFNVTVTNVGTLPVSSMFVAGKSISGLAARGGTASVTVSQSAVGLLGINSTRSYSASYQNPSGSTLNATTNSISDVFSHTSMKIGRPSLVVSAQLATLSNQEMNLTLKFTSANVGPTNVTSFTATANLPSGLGCGAVSGKGISCAGDQLVITYPVINSSSALTSYMKYNLTAPANYFLTPIEFTGTTSIGSIAGESNPVAIPSGLVLSKAFSPALLFGGMNSSVEVSLTNSGPLPFYNVTLGTTIDGFDTLSKTALLSKTVSSVAAGGNTSFSYGVSALQVTGNQSASLASASLVFGGVSYSIQGAASRVVLYQPLGVSISTYPAAPEEGKTFTINIVITNPSGVSVSNVLFTLPVPAGLGLSNLQNAQVSSGILTVSPGTIAPHGVYNASASAVASSGILIPFDKAKLTFTYSGVTIGGVLPSKSGIGIAEDVTTRYVIPIGVVLLVLLATAFYLRRMAGPSVPASQK